MTAILATARTVTYRCATALLFTGVCEMLLQGFEGRGTRMTGGEAAGSRPTNHRTTGPVRGDPRGFARACLAARAASRLDELARHRSPGPPCSVRPSKRRRSRGGIRDRPGWIPRAPLAELTAQRWVVGVGAVGTSGRGRPGRLSERCGPSGGIREGTKRAARAHVAARAQRDHRLVRMGRSRS